MAPTSDPFHQGERLAQERAGERALADKHAAILRGEIEPRARPFREQRLLAAAVVARRRALASVLAVEPAGAPRLSRVDLDCRAWRVIADPFGAWPPGADTGLWPSTFAPRRLRINAVAGASSGGRARCAIVPDGPK